MGLFLLVSVQGCATVYSAIEFVPCRHPVIHTSTNGELVQAIVLYADALDTCNTVNGAPPVQPEEDAGPIQRFKNKVADALHGSKSAAPGNQNSKVNQKGKP